MRRHVLLYGVLGGVLIAVLKFVEVRWLVLEHSLAIYGGIVAALFSGLGLWLGLRLTRPAAPVVVREVVVPAPPGFERDARNVASLGLTPRELQVLELIAEGLSNKEIADRLDIAVKTVMAHRANLMDKLDIHNRAKLVQLAIRKGLLPMEG